MFQTQLSHADNLIREIVHGLGKRASSGTAAAMPAEIDVRVGFVTDAGAKISGSL